MPSYKILIPHKKKKPSFIEFGGNFGGLLQNDITEYTRNYLYWVFQVPGSDIKAGWYAKIPPIEHILKWRDHVMTYSNPAVSWYRDEYRNIFGYTKATELFDSALKTYERN